MCSYPQKLTIVRSAARAQASLAKLQAGCRAHEEQVCCTRFLLLSLWLQFSLPTVCHRRCSRHPRTEHQSKARHRASDGRADPIAVFDEEYVFVDIDNIPSLSTDNQVGSSHQDLQPSSSAVGVFQHDQQGTEHAATDSHILATVGTDSTASKITLTNGKSSTEPNNLLPVSCQCSVLVQGYLAGLIAPNVLHQSSSQPPTIHHPLLGIDGLQLLSRIKRQVALKFHSDKSVGVESDAYKQFNSRVDELSKATGDYIGWTRYNQMLDVEIDAARQYLQHV